MLLRLSWICSSKEVAAKRFTEEFTNKYMRHELENSRDKNIEKVYCNRMWILLKNLLIGCMPDIIFDD